MLPEYKIAEGQFNRAWEISAEDTIRLREVLAHVTGKKDGGLSPQKIHQLMLSYARDGYVPSHDLIIRFIKSTGRPLFRRPDGYVMLVYLVGLLRKEGDKQFVHFENDEFEFFARYCERYFEEMSTDMRFRDRYLLRYRNVDASMHPTKKSQPNRGKVRRASSDSSRLRAAEAKQPLTRIGRTIVNNKEQIEISVAALLLLFDEKIATLREYRPNSDGEIRERDVEVARYQNLYRELKVLRLAVAGVSTNVSEEAAVRSARGFAGGIRSWWTSSHKEICSRTFETALFLSAVGVCKLIGTDSSLPVAVLGVLVGGKPIIGMLKSISRALPKITSP